ncbi:hypothetical protein [Dapis sp. BLCC M172]|uniref:hypothetical protein n=1 Tax=Dapis sp. BLCC M172 TaxID=2975281 RepID=UPI003CF5CF85
MWEKTVGVWSPNPNPSQRDLETKVECSKILTLILKDNLDLAVAINQEKARY